MTDVLDRIDTPQTTRFLSVDDLRNLPKPKPLVDGLLYADSLAEIPFVELQVVGDPLAGFRKWGCASCSRGASRRVRGC